MTRAWAWTCCRLGTAGLLDVEEERISEGGSSAATVEEARAVIVCCPWPCGKAPYHGSGLSWGVGGKQTARKRDNSPQAACRTTLEAPQNRANEEARNRRPSFFSFSYCPQRGVQSFPLPAGWLVVAEAYGHQSLKDGVRSWELLVCPSWRAQLHPNIPLAHRRHHLISPRWTSFVFARHNDCSLDCSDRSSPGERVYTHVYDRMRKRGRGGGVSIHQ